MKHRIRIIHRHLKRSSIRANLKLLKLNAKVYEGIIRFKTGNRRYRSLVVARSGSILAVLLLVFHILSPSLTSQIAFALNGDSNLNGFIWENDDSSSSDGHSQVAVGNEGITVPRGSRLNLRTQIKNTGSQMDLSKLGLFYDKMDNMWSQVETSGQIQYDGASLANTTALIDLPGSSAVSPYTASELDSNGVLWVAYAENAGGMYVAQYVGTGGSGCDNPAWTCTAVDDGGDVVDDYLSIAFDSLNNPWISYYDTTNTALKVANYVGTGGNCTSSAWNCTIVDNTSTITGTLTSIAFDSTDTAWVSYYDTTNTALKVATYVGTGGNCTSSAWNCTTVDNTGTSTGQYTSIAIDSTDTVWVSFYDVTNTALRVAEFVGGGSGNCTDTNWDCSAVDNTGTSTGQYTSIAINPMTDEPWISYQDVTGTSLKVAVHVGSGGNCTSTAWNCAVVDNTGTSSGQATDIGFSSNGVAWVVYRDVTNLGVRVALYAPPDGIGSGCTDSDWSCVTIEGGSTGSTQNSISIDSEGDAWVTFYSALGAGVYFRKVTPEDVRIQAAGSTNCSVMSGMECQILSNTASEGTYTSIAVSPSGVPWISYYSTTSTALFVASKSDEFASSGGGSCLLSGWTGCDVVDNTGTNTGQYTSIAFDAQGNPWISYYDVTNTALKVANYVGSGGNCTNTAWDCTTVDNSASVGSFTSIAFDAAGTAWVSYYSATNTALMVANYVGSGGNCTSTAWDCTIADNTGLQSGQYSAIAIDPSGNPWVSHFDGNQSALRVTNYVGGGGNCTDANWNCTTVWNDTSGFGYYSSIAIDHEGTPWVAHANLFPAELYISKYVGSGGNCTDTAWECTPLENVNLSDGAGSNGIDITIDPAGNPTVAFRDSGAASLRLAKYVGSGGTCNNTAWICQTVDDLSGARAEYLSAAYDLDGNLWISYQDAGSTALRIANSKRGGEIYMAASERANGAITESHADMTTITDTANRDDADCIGGGTWNNGVLVTGDFGGIGTLPDGSSTAQCTELSFTLDFSNAQPGMTYRFMVSSFENISSGDHYWRGPVSIAGGAIPTITISDDSFAEQVAVKDNTMRLPDCADTEWGCADAITSNDVGTFGTGKSLVMDRAGVPWVSFYDTTSDDLVVAKYVGSGGSGCGVSQWNCTTVDSTNDVGQYSAIAFDQSGSPWVSYYDATNGNLRIAEYVSSGGSGCASSAWTCTAIDTTNNVGQYTDLGFDNGGVPIVAYYDVTNGNLRVARYHDGATIGSGCAVTTWTCTIIDSTNDVGQYLSMLIDNFGVPWISYYDATNGDLRVARQRASGGSGCAATGWFCSTVISTNDVGKYTAITSDGNSVYVAHYESASGSCDNSPTTECSLHIAAYTGTGSGCADASWTCDIVDNPTGSGDYGKYSSVVATTSDLFISYYDDLNDNLRVARYDLNVPGDTSSGCSNTVDWYCTTVDSTGDVGSYTAIVHADEVPYISYYDLTNGNIRLAKVHRSALNFSYGYGNDDYTGGRRGSQFSVPGKYPLTLGQRNGSNPGNCTGAATNYLGMCALYADGGTYDTIEANANESPTLSLGQKTRNSITEAPTIRWIGTTTLAPNTSGVVGDIHLQLYNYTNGAWEDIAVDSSSSDCSSQNCVLSGTPSSSIGNYRTFTPIYNVIGGTTDVRQMLIRIYQEASSSSSITFKTDQFSAFTTSQKLGSGSLFQDGVERPLNQR